MTHRAIVISKPYQNVEHYEFNCLFEERHPPKSQPLELQIGNKVLLHENETIEKSPAAPNLFWIERIEKL